MMSYDVLYTDRAKKDMEALSGDQSKKGIWKSVNKAIGYLAENPRHPSLKTHQYHSIPEVYPGQKVWEAYAQDKTPSAYRIFWAYGPVKGQITIIAVTPHP